VNVKRVDMIIDKSITIEELVEKVPEAILYLSKNGIRCVLCGEPIWGTLEEAAKQKGFSDDDIERFVKDINRLAAGEE
jgi:methionine synthase II (cobalamin-independent)